MKRTAIIFVSVIMILFSAAFVFYINDSDENLSSASSIIKDKLIVGIAGDVDSFNPLFGESSIGKDITHLMMLGLADLNDKSEFTGELAESWERSQDYLTLTYYLRKDAHWSDGVAITAEDVKFTYDLLRDTSVASPNGWVTDFIKQVKVVDPRTVVFEFTKAYPDQLFDTAGEIVPKHILENVDRKEIRSHEFGRNPIVSGPFKLKKWQGQQYLELIPNEYYFGEQPLLKRIIFKIIPDKTNMLLQLQTGEIDMMIGVEPDQVARLKAQNPEIRIYPISGRVYYYIGYNQKKSFFTSSNVRRALTMAIDRNKLIDASLQGFGKTCTGPVPPMIDWAYNNNIKEIPFDPDRAKTLLSDEGWTDSDDDGWIDKNGRTFEFILRTNTGNQIKSDLGVIVQDQLRKIGIKVSLETLEWTTFQKKLRKKNFDAYVGGWSTSFNVDPTPIFHSKSGELFNHIAYNEPQVDNLIEIGRAEMDRDAAAIIWKQLQQKVYDDQPYTFLFWIDKIVAVHSRFQNATPIPLSMFYGLEHWYEKRTADE